MKIKIIYILDGKKFAHYYEADTKEEITKMHQEHLNALKKNFTTVSYDYVA